MWQGSRLGDGSVSTPGHRIGRGDASGACECEWEWERGWVLGLHVGMGVGEEMGFGPARGHGSGRGDGSGACAWAFE